MGFQGNFLIIGHRGAAGLAPENTLASFRQAAALGVDAVELDVHVVESQLVVIHDDTVDRTTDGHGPLAGRSIESLRGLDAGDGERVPLLDEVFAALPPGVGVNVELKGRGTGALFGDRLPDGGREILVSSFDRTELGAFRARRPDVPCAPLYAKRRSGMIAQALALDAWSIHLAEDLIDPDLIDRLADAGFRVLAYTVNDGARAAELADMGVSGVFTDYPDRIGRP